MVLNLNKKSICDFLITFIIAYAALFLAQFILFDFDDRTSRVLRRTAFLALVVALESKLFENKLTFAKSLILLVLLALPPLSVSASNYDFSINNATFIALISASCLCVFFISLFSQKARATILILLCLIVSIPSLIFCGYYSYSGAPIGQEAIVAALETNSHEAIQYLQTQNNLWQYAIIAALFIICFVFVKITQKLQIKSALRPLTAVFLFAATMPFYNDVLGDRGDDLYSTLYKSVKTHFAMYAKFEKETPTRLKSIKINKNGDEEGLYVLVIGESQNKKRMSAYGYERDTTPFIGSNLNNPNLILFSNAFSNHTHTSFVLEEALTSKNQYNNAALIKSPTLVEVANLAGFETFWLSNQAKLHESGVSITKIAMGAKNKFFTRDGSGAEPFDEVLIEQIPTQLKNSKTLMIIHLYGNHHDYKKRYPQDFAKFGGGYSNEYDNSILYNDYVIQKLLNKVVKIPHFKALVYFADHSELLVVKDEHERVIGHDSSRFDFEMTYIPFYMYFSDDYIAAHQDLISNLRSHKNDYFTNDLIFNVMNGIMGISTNFDEPKNDISAKAYDTNASRFKTLHGKRFLIEDNGTN